MATLTSSPQLDYPEASWGHGNRKRDPWVRAGKSVLAVFKLLSGPPATDRERTRRETAHAQVSRYQSMSGVWNQRC
ncbi:MAG: hypothetical protein CL696_08040 [Chloroflexi bacterium]|nr:hypothetical protein [Chloroflexota bacterium]